ncbi:heavy metal translocating P-type ATPase [Desulfovibrio sp. JC010]|uniref:heavy metal translocating P-type ATPase n=1 Tax=Desulfovibrio sp. JC010 TaxID=2593641 RepID=UPI0013D0F8F0|nr:heavy metal translocating P-type ATPase [Desulfovibrio sp. JC010]NDV28543.1 heavy metal translocating P-type ATPase [Desulfovibrio sp. JC010]
MSTAKAHGPRIVHETAKRIRFKWSRLLSPELDPDYLEAWLSNLPGVDAARINPPARSLVIKYDGTADNREQILAGFERIPSDAFGKKEPAGRRRRLIDAAFSAHLAAVLPFVPPAVQAPVAIAMGGPVVLSGLDSLINEGLTARVLDMTTIGASLLRTDFTTAASIAAMVVVGDYLRTMTDDKSNSLLKSLTADPVDKVWVKQDGKEQGISFDEVKIGDTVLCGNGDLVAVDGVVTKGEALLDKSSITGESTPVTVTAGDEIISGSVVVEGKLEISATQTGADTSMARIAEFMTRALQEQSKAEKQSDRLADALTPITLGLGAALYAVTGDMERALSVLTIDFACAVKFPAPVVIKTSMHTAAKEGILFKSGSALEYLAEVDAVVFDKTGTLTCGELAVTDIELCADYDEDEFIRLASAVEDRYGHPVGLAIIRNAEERNLTPHPATEIDLTIAHGVSGMVGGKLIRVGNRHFIADDCGVDCSAVSEKAAELRAEGKTLVYVSADGELIGIAALMDTIRDEAAEIVESLKENGIKKVIMLTGDHKGTADFFAAQFQHVDEIRAELTPDKKAAEVKRLQDEGYKVAVVGDGVNDAPAFTVANVGICMSQSTGLARESAQIVLTKNSLHGLLDARSISLRVNTILKNCFRTGVGVNVGLMGAATAGLLKPTAAAALHNLNTFAILGAAAWSSSRRI